MPCEAVNRGATFLFMGALSQVCGGSDGSVLDVLFNLWPNPNASRLCSETYMVQQYGVAPTHTVLKTHIV